jgi:NodT family efflux transporter outer membrane factor (OMF) lipoprotein
VTRPGIRPALPVAMVLALAASGCVVGPDYREPAAAVPDGWTNPLIVPADATAVAADQAWWARFADPLLTALIAEALVANPDLQRAEAAIREARAERTKAAAGLFPTLDGQASYQRNRNSENFSSGGGGSAAADGGFSTGTLVNDRYVGRFDSSWEIDLFGKVRRGIEATRAGIGAAEATAADVRLTLIGDVARNYVELRGFQRQIAVVRQQVASQEDTLSLTRAKFKAGTGTGLDVVRAEQQLAATAADLPPLTTELKARVHQISILVGRPPGELKDMLAPDRPIPIADAALEAGVPADLVRRRPDVRAAERQLAQATALIGVAVADRYPTLTINGSVGIGSRNLAQLFKPESLLWSVGPQLDIPVFDGFRRQAEVDVQQARTDQAAAGFRTAVLAALADVENALVAYAEEEQRRSVLARSVDSARDALNLAQELYIRGLSPFLDVLVAQRTLFQAENALAVSESAVSTDLIAIYKALAGGWAVPAAAAAP